MQELFPLADSYRKRDWKNTIFSVEQQSGNMNKKKNFSELFKDTDMEEDMNKESEPFLEKSE